MRKSSVCHVHSNAQPSLHAPQTDPQKIEKLSWVCSVCTFYLTDSLVHGAVQPYAYFDARNALSEYLHKLHQTGQIDALRSFDGHT